MFYRNHFINVYGQLDKAAGFWSPVISITGPDRDSLVLNGSGRLSKTKECAEIFGLEKAKKWIDEHTASSAAD